MGRCPGLVRGPPSSGGDLPISGANATASGTIDIESSAAGVLLRRSQAVRDLPPLAAVHLIRRLAPKRGVGETAVVLLDVERDEPPDLGGGVELVQEEPIVLQAPPPGLDQRVSIPLEVNTPHDRS